MRDGLMSFVPITEQEFCQFQRFIFEAAGITMPSSKKALISGRLAKRLSHFRVDSYGEYFKLMASGAAPGEVQIAIDLLTTNETYFFREAKHFELLRSLAHAATAARRPLKVWSAACSTGEEPYSIAMVLEEMQPGLEWEVTGTDISSRVLAAARTGHYLLERATQMPTHYRNRFCLKGFGEQDGTLLVQRPLRQRVQFQQMNLNAASWPTLDSYDVVFLRNVLIYFSAETKRKVVTRVLTQLKPGGHLLIGHSESLHDMVGAGLHVLAPSIYRKGVPHG